MGPRRSSRATLPATLPRSPILAIAPPRDQPARRGHRHADEPGHRVARPGRADPALRRPVHDPHRVGREADVPGLGPDRHPGPKGAPLLYAGVRAGLPTAVLAFEPRRSDLPLQVAFPILLANLTGELLGGSSAPTEAVAPGAPVTLQVPAGATGVTRHPARRHDHRAGAEPGERVGGDLRADRPAGHLHRDADRRRGRVPCPVGCGRADAAAIGHGRRERPAASASPGTPAVVVDPNAPVRFAVDLFDLDESSIAPGSPAAIEALGTTAAVPGASAAPGTARPVERPTTRDELWIPIVLLVLVGLCIEWAVYHRDAVIRVRRSLSGAAPAAARRRDRLMGISFTEPLWLLLLVPALALTIGLHLAARRRMGAGRRRTALVVRSVLLSALVLAIAGFQLVLPVDRLATVFVVDLSDSVGNAGRSEALAFLRETLKEKPQGDVAGIVAFGKDALVERLPSELEDIDRIASTPVESATDIGAALRLATALFPDDSQKRIVLLSDGNDTTGGGAAEASLAASRGIRIETKAIGLGNVDEVLVERLTTPSIARLGESVQAVAEIRSSVAQTATVRLFADGALVATQPVQLEAGVTRVTFDVKPTEAGFHTFRAVVEAARDTFSQNDRADSNTIVKGEPRTLILAGDDQVASQLVAALKAQRQQVDTMVPEALPSDLASLATLRQRRARRRPADPPERPAAGRPPGLRPRPRQGARDGRREGQLRRRRLPEDAARGVAAGRHGRARPPEAAGHRARGRHRQVRFDGGLPLQHVRPRHGGSSIAGVQKVDIGKEAILRAAAAMTERDELGVVAFNESAHWVVHTQPLGTVGDLQGQLAGDQGGRPDEHLRGARPGGQVARGRRRRRAATSSC